MTGHLLPRKQYRRHLPPGKGLYAYLAYTVSLTAIGVGPVGVLLLGRFIHAIQKVPGFKSRPFRFQVGLTSLGKLSPNCSHLFLSVTKQ